VFNQREHLRDHLKFHLNPRIKPYSCSACGYCNDRKDNVQQHVVKVHHKKCWVETDIKTDHEGLEKMSRIISDWADKIMGYNELSPRTGRSFQFLSMAGHARKYPTAMASNKRSGTLSIGSAPDIQTVGDQDKKEKSKQ